ncbi:MAG: 50S ribosomal protein L24 [Candidatus Wildermuthbacteria bacterium]|nr:50S ribosomal protein L24 [Candidatus Wildermuthbacteria bacterium]
MRVKKGDNVIVTSGKDRGKKGKVLRALPREARIVVEGVNIRKKHVKAKRADQKGQIVEMPAMFSVSSVKLVCEKCGKPTRVGYAVTGKKKSRICKKCGAEI